MLELSTGVLHCTVPRLKDAATGALVVCVSRVGEMEMELVLDLAGGMEKERMGEEIHSCSPPQTERVVC